jgi:REP element-mobilizing transposase RayT
MLGMGHSYTGLLTHIVFSTSERRPFLNDEILPDVHAYMGGILRELNVSLIAIGGTPDHVHLLIRLPANLSVADCLRLLKTKSSRWIKEKWNNRKLFARQGGYGAFSVSQSNSNAVARYICDQAQHHFRISFQNEFLELLKRHGVEFDEKYLWS